MSEPSESIESRLDNRCINTLRMLAVDMVEHANSGHPGMPMGAAPMAYVLWTRHLRFNPRNADWCNRDRFVLSAGHGSALLYAMLHLSGYDLTLEDLKNFRQWGSRTPGHPERNETPGVEVTTGPLGQGFANAVGFAMAERYLAATFNQPGYDVVDHATYVLCSDGDLMEGISAEAASLAGHLKLGKLIGLYDENQVSLAADIRLSFTEKVQGRFEAYGWQVLPVSDGNDVDAIDRALHEARAESSRPSLIIVRTRIGYGSPGLEGSFHAHGAPLGKEEIAATKKRLKWPSEPTFHVPDEVRDCFQKYAEEGIKREETWNDMMAAWDEAFPELREQWGRFIRGELPKGWESDIPVYPADYKPIATRTAGGEVMNAIARRVGNLVGGSADLDPSTKTALKGRGSFQPSGSGDDRVQGSEKGAWSYAGANIAFGVREHAMGGILNGIAAHGGLIPYGSTFLIFSDYLRPSLRLAALSGLDVRYIFTHDSIAVGEDGPTHQPVEHLASFRAMPNVVVIRPADANEAAEAWRTALRYRGGPVLLVMSRQNLPVIDQQRFAPARGLAHGAYILAEAGKGLPDLILIATGAEVHPALQARERLEEDGVSVRLISMPSWELFDDQQQDYRDMVLPPGVPRRLAVEAGSTQGWYRYVGPQGAVIGIDRFGASAPGEVNLEKFGFTADNIERQARRLLEK